MLHNVNTFILYKSNTWERGLTDLIIVTNKLITTQNFNTLQNTASNFDDHMNLKGVGYT